VSAQKGFQRRLFAPARVASNHKRGALGLLCAGVVAGAAGLALAQPMSDQQIRCMQLQQELSAQSGGGGGREALPGIEKQIQDTNRIYQGTRAAMEDAGCYESFFIFGRGLVRSPKCLQMSARMEDASRQLDQLQQQRQAILGGGGNRRRQAELQDALARSGCTGQVPQQAARQRSGGGGFFDWFGGGGGQEVEPGTDTSISRSINPNAPYRTVCVRLCDGFFYPISYSTYASRFSQDATQCQQNCAAPAELYVYRNPGQEIEQAISLNGSPYKDLPVAFKYRKSYTAGCSCKEAEYNPTEIEQANKKAEATPPAKGGAKVAAKKAATPDTAAATPPAAPAGAPQQLDIDITGATPAEPAKAEAAAEPQPAPAPQAQPAGAPPAAAPAGPQSSVAKTKTPAPH
jgi:hypothetical protein